MLNLIIDLGLLAILVLSALKGRKKGFISGLVSVLALTAALLLSNLVSRAYSGEFTTMLEPFVSGIVSKTAEDATQAGASADVREQAYEALRSVGVMKSAAANIAGEIAGKTSEGGYVLRNALVERLCAVYAQVLTAAIAFILLLILLSVIANLTSLELRLPAVDSIDASLGLAFGFLKGLIFVFAIAWAAGFGGMVLKENVVDKTILLEFCMNVNPINAIFGF
jgi:uncharacterized membrane protein required for colicin V production